MAYIDKMQRAPTAANAMKNFILNIFKLQDLKIINLKTKFDATHYYASVSYQVYKNLLLAEIKKKQQHKSSFYYVGIPLKIHTEQFFSGLSFAFLSKA